MHVSWYNVTFPVVVAVDYSTMVVELQRLEEDICRHEVHALIRIIWRIIIYYFACGNGNPSQKGSKL